MHRRDVRRKKGGNAISARVAMVNKVRSEFGDSSFMAADFDESLTEINCLGQEGPTIWVKEYICMSSNFNNMAIGVSSSKNFHKYIGCKKLTILQAYRLVFIYFKSQLPFC